VDSSPLRQALQAYQRFDPPGWLSLYRVLPTYVGLLFCLLGAFYLAWGSSRALRLWTVPLGAAVGYLAGPSFIHALQIQLPPQVVIWGPTLGLAVVGLLSPPVVLFFAVGVPVGLLAAEMTGRSDAIVALAAGFLVSGVAAVLLWRRLAALGSAAAGAWLLVLGLLSALHALLPFLGVLAQRTPAAMYAVAAILAVIGAAYQLSRPAGGWGSRPRPPGLGKPLSPGGRRL
jgi:hypothetical protein